MTMAGGHSLFEIALDASHAGWRLDRALADIVSTLSRERLKVLTKAGALTRPDGSAARDPGTKVKGDEAFTLLVPAADPAHNEPQDIALPIVYEDEHLLVVDKPAGMVVHPAAGNRDGTMAILTRSWGERARGASTVPPRRPGTAEPMAR